MNLRAPDLANTSTAALEAELMRRARESDVLARRCADLMADSPMGPSIIRKAQVAANERAQIIDQMARIHAELNKREAQAEAVATSTLAIAAELNKSREGN